MPASDDRSEKGHSPLARFQFGGVSASVFANVIPRSDGTSFEIKRTTLQRSYRDEQGNWRTTNTYGVDDLPRAVAALLAAYHFCLTGERHGSEQ